MCQKRSNAWCVLNRTNILLSLSPLMMNIHESIQWDSVRGERLKRNSAALDRVADLATNKILYVMLLQTEPISVLLSVCRLLLSLLCLIPPPKFMEIDDFLILLLHTNCTWARERKRESKMKYVNSMASQPAIRWLPSNHALISKVTCHSRCCILYVKSMYMHVHNVECE